ncbi:MAG: MraY family glycosyltransferase [Thiobacillaceae bacterium]
MLTEPIWAPAAAFIVCWVTLAGLLRRRNILPLDHPNERSLHVMPTPRIGGLGIMAGWLVAAGWLATNHSLQSALSVVLTAFVLSALSMLDDVRGLPVTLRLLAHFCASLVCLLALGLADWTAVLGALALTWMTNLYNFMDGTDGLAGGMALFGFGAYGIAAWDGGAINLALINWSISASALGFLLFNFPPARVFMGDAGSIPLGFLAGALGVLGWQEKVWAAWFPVLVFSPFIVDATITLIRRSVGGEKIWQAHKSHYYQRVVRLGLSHRQLALTEYGLMVAVAGSAVWASRGSANRALSMLLVWGPVYLIIGALIDTRWRREHGHEL